MRNRFFRLLLLFSAVVTTAACGGYLSIPPVDIPDPGGPAEPQNLMRNPSFEDVNEDGKPVYYGFSAYAGDPEVVVDSSVARTGQNSVRITGDDDARGLFFTSVEVEGGKAYQFSIWFRTTENIQAGQVRARLMAYDQPSTSDDYKVDWQGEWLFGPAEGAPKVLPPNFVIENLGPSVGEWQQLMATFKLPGEVVVLRVEGFNEKGNGSVWFDDLSLIEVDPDDFE